MPKVDIAIDKILVLENEKALDIQGLFYFIIARYLKLYLGVLILFIIKVNHKGFINEQLELIYY